MGQEDIERRCAFRVRVPGGIASVSFGSEAQETHNLNVRDLSVGGALLCGRWGQQDLNVSDRVKLRICWPKMGPTEVRARVVRVDRDRGELAVQFSKSDESIAWVRSLVMQHQRVERPEAVVYCQSESGDFRDVAIRLVSILNDLGMQASLAASSVEVLVAIRKSASGLSAVFLDPGDKGQKLASFLATGYPHLSRIVIGAWRGEWEGLAHRFVSVPLDRAQIERAVQEEVPRADTEPSER